MQNSPNENSRPVNNIIIKCLEDRIKSLANDRIFGLFAAHNYWDAPQNGDRPPPEMGPNVTPQVIKLKGLIKTIHS